MIIQFSELHVLNIILRVCFLLSFCASLFWLLSQCKEELQIFSNHSATIFLVNWVDKQHCSIVPWFIRWDQTVDRTLVFGYSLGEVNVSNILIGPAIGCREFAIDTRYLSTNKSSNSILVTSFFQQFNIPLSNTLLMQSNYKVDSSNPLMVQDKILHYMWKFVSGLPQISGFLLFLPSIQLIAIK